MAHENFSTVTTVNHPDTLGSVQKILLSSVSLFKVYSFYPADHAITGNNLAKFKAELQDFLSNRGILRLETWKNNFYYEDEMIFSGPEHNAGWSRKQIKSFGYNFRLLKKKFTKGDVVSLGSYDDESEGYNIPITESMPPAEYLL